MRISSKLEKDLYKQGYKNICGIDEVGRGSLAGPLVLAGVILPTHTRFPGLNDSKKLSKKQREHLDKLIRKQSRAFHIARVESHVIDEINIWQSFILGIKEIIHVLRPDYVILDGISVKAISIPMQAIVGGDGKIRCLAAASVIAKVHRDKIMVEYMKEYPQYYFEKHKGYATPLHKHCLKEHGPCDIHRKSYQPVRETCMLKNT